MKIAGIIAEYNPFHSGHAYHIEKTREITLCDYVVICMSGNFVQRGEAACMDKWRRAEMALKCGADAVFELPALFAVRTADAFARGGVAVLDGIGCDYLCFGSENADIEYLKKAADIRENEPAEISELVKQALSEGKSHARALGEAAARYLDMPAEALNAPNNTLGVEYIRAIRRLGSQMQPVAIERKGSYHAESMEEGGFASASAIRKAISEGDIEAAQAGVPENVREYLSGIRMHAPDDLLLHTLRRMTPEMIASLPDVGEGLENRVFKCAQTAATVEELISEIKCKRYTQLRLMRLCAHAMLNLTREFADQHPLPEYARLIGMRSDAAPLLGEIGRRAKIDVVSDAAKLKDNEIFRLECRATDLRALLCDDREERKAGQEFTRKFVKV
ncbi:MAG: nucleotidyltransferase [Clostridia bacterium]|nr:nucleotidyltransferase [Clostridia bacterium]